MREQSMWQLWWCLKYMIVSVENHLDKLNIDFLWCWKFFFSQIQRKIVVKLMKNYFLSRTLIVITTSFINTTQFTIYLLFWSLVIVRYHFYSKFRLKVLNIYFLFFCKTDKPIHKKTSLLIFIAQSSEKVI